MTIRRTFVLSQLRRCGASLLAHLVRIMVDLVSVGSPNIFRDVDSLTPGDELQPTICRRSDCDVFHAMDARATQSLIRAPPDRRKNLFGHETS